MQIPPKYNLTPPIIDLIARIEANRIFLNQSNLKNEIVSKIERVSLLKSSLFSARIEGNPIDLDNFTRTSDKLKKKEITNILKTITFIKSKPQEVTRQLIQKIHLLVMKNLSPQAGKFRHEVSAIFNTAGIAVYMPPPPKMLDELISKLMFFIKNTPEKYHLVTAFMAHLLFEKIHPFLDGNGRVGRLLIFAVLQNKGWSFPVFVPIEEYIDEHKDEYYYHLDIGLTEPESFLEFCLRAFYETSENIRKQISNELNSQSQILLPPRQDEILKIIKDHNMVSMDFIKRRFLKIPSRTLRYDLEKLTKLKLIVKIGKTKGSFYKSKY